MNRTALNVSRQRLGLRQSSAVFVASGGAEGARGLAQSKIWRCFERFMGRGKGAQGHPMRSSQIGVGAFLRRSAIAVLLAASVLFFSGCQHTYMEIPVAGVAARSKLRTDSIVLVAIPADGRFKNQFASNSGQITAVALRDAFAKFVKRAYVGRKVQSFADGLETARTNNCTYFIFPTILRWENHATEFSGRRDLVEIKIEVAASDTGEILHATILRGRSRWFSDGGDMPQDLLEEPVRNYVTSLFQPVHIPTALR